MDEEEQFEAEQLLAAMEDEDEDEDDEAIKIESTQNLNYKQPCESYSDIIDQLKIWQPNKTKMNCHTP